MQEQCARTLLCTSLCIDSKIGSGQAFIERDSMGRIESFGIKPYHSQSSGP